jgi:hypothetical protein
MKVKIEIDLSPEEARSFLGLPDLSMVHKAFLDSASGKLESAASLVDVEPLIKTWTGLGGMAQDVFGSFLSTALKGTTGAAASTPPPSKPKTDAT